VSLTIDVNGMLKFLEQLLSIPSPVGDTHRAIEFVRSAFADLGLKTHVPPKGYLTATWDIEGSDAPRAVSAHIDTLGAMVSKLKANGRISLTKLGGWDWNSVEAEGVSVLLSNGDVIRGSILPVKASGHAYTPKERTAERTDDTMEARLDVVAETENDLRDLGVCVGDTVAIDPRVEVTGTGFVRSRHLDDKAGIACIYGALAAIREAGMQPAQRTTAHISNYEEVGHGGSVGFPSDLAELLVVDMAVVAPSVLGNERKVTICAKDSSGPYDNRLRRRLEEICATEKIDYVSDIYPYYGSDGSVYWRTGGSALVGLVGPGVDASHHYERTHRDGLEHTARLVAAYLLS